MCSTKLWYVKLALTHFLYANSVSVSVWWLNLEKKSNFKLLSRSHPASSLLDYFIAHYFQSLSTISSSLIMIWMFSIAYHLKLVCSSYNSFNFLFTCRYRDFPLASYPELAVPGERLYSCNFMGTVYENSSRVELANIITSINKRHAKQVCYLKVRQK